MIATYIIEGRCYGTGPAPMRFAKEDLRPQWSVAFFCPVCGEVWARVIVPGQNFIAQHVSCRKHRTHALEVPGSIYLNWDPDFTDNFPLEVYKRELELALQQYDKEQSQCPISESSASTSMA